MERHAKIQYVMDKVNVLIKEINQDVHVMMDMVEIIVRKQHKNYKILEKYI